MGSPAGFLLTWTCYGTWLHGDARGAADRYRNVHGTIGVPPDSGLLIEKLRRLKHPARQLCDEARRVVAAALEAECAFRGWSLRAVNARTNHVHAVIVDVDGSAEEALRMVKAEATRALRRAGLADSAPVWTRHGSTVYLWSGEDVAGAVRYVLEGQ